MLCSLMIFLNMALKAMDSSEATHCEYTFPCKPKILLGSWACFVSFINLWSWRFWNICKIRGDLKWWDEYENENLELVIFSCKNQGMKYQHASKCEINWLMSVLELYGIYWLSESQDIQFHVSQESLNYGSYTGERGRQRIVRVIHWLHLQAMFGAYGVM